MERRTEYLHEVLDTDLGRRWLILSHDTTDSPSAPELKDYEETLRDLNGRLGKLVGKIKGLTQENSKLRQEISHLERERSNPEGRKWDDTWEPLKACRVRIDAVTKENTELLLSISEAKYKHALFENLFEYEEKACEDLRKDQTELEKFIEEIKEKKDNLTKEIESLNKELIDLKGKHKKDVDDLCEKVKEAKVTVEIEAEDSNLNKIIEKIRDGYEKEVKASLKKMEDWYNEKIKKLNSDDLKTLDELEETKWKLQNLLKTKEQLKFQTETVETTIKSLTILREDKKQSESRQSDLTQLSKNLEERVEKVKLQIQLQKGRKETLEELTEKLKEEISEYRSVIEGIPTNES